LQEDAPWRRRLPLAVGVALVAALCVAAILLAGSRSQEASRGSASEEATQSTAPERATTGNRSPTEAPRLADENEALVADARGYAKSMGVSLEEAIRRLKMQGGTAPSDVERELKRSERDAYAGLWIRHKPDYGITVAAARDFEAVEEKARSQVEGTQWEGTIRIKPVEASLVELRAARAEADKIFERLGITASSGENLSKNRIEFYVKDEAEFESKLNASGLELPDHVVVMEGETFPAVPE
jgi:hypothetical protein